MRIPVHIRIAILCGASLLCLESIGAERISSYQSLALLPVQDRVGDRSVVQEIERAVASTLERQATLMDVGEVRNTLRRMRLRKPG